MQFKRIIYFFVILFCTHVLMAQQSEAEQKADARSYSLYTTGHWKELLRYGKSQLDNEIDIPYLRMRTGYAAFMLGNFSESLTHYEKVYARDRNNTDVLYYVYLNNLYLNNANATRFYGRKLPPVTRDYEKLKRVGIASVNTTYSYKIPMLAIRGNGQYVSLGANIHLGYRLELQQSVAWFHQTISETQMLAVKDSSNIVIAQKEYYGKLIFTATGKLSFSGGFHYIYTPFNNYTYHNKMGFAGVTYTMPYVHFKAMFHSGTISDSVYRQYDAEITLYPLGNTNLYSISRGAFGKAVVFTQIAGVKVYKNIWLEANATFRQYDMLLENDGMYLFNDIDTKKFKAGGSIYILMAKKLTLTLNYCNEQKIRWGTTTETFNQHSITTSLSWKF